MRCRISMIRVQLWGRILLGIWIRRNQWQLTVVTLWRSWAKEERPSIPVSRYMCVSVWSLHLSRTCKLFRKLLPIHCELHIFRWGWYSFQSQKSEWFRDVWGGGNHRMSPEMSNGDCIYLFFMGSSWQIHWFVHESRVVQWMEFIVGRRMNGWRNKPTIGVVKLHSHENAKSTDITKLWT